jgi:hypothetical protein
MYNQYVNNYAANLSTLQRLTKSNKSFASFCEEHKQKTKSKLDLQSYLIMPVQRLPRYEILLAQIVENSKGENLRGFDKLCDAFNRIHESNIFVNESAREAENKHKIMELMCRIKGTNVPLIEPTRKLLRQDIVDKLPKSKRKDDKSDILILFNDALLLLSYDYKVKHWILSDEVEIIRCVDANAKADGSLSVLQEHKECETPASPSSSTVIGGCDIEIELKLHKDEGSSSSSSLGLRRLSVVLKPLKPKTKGTIIRLSFADDEKRNTWIQLVDESSKLPLPGKKLTIQLSE